MRHERSSAPRRAAVQPVVRRREGRAVRPRRPRRAARRRDGPARPRAGSRAARARRRRPRRRLPRHGGRRRVAGARRVDRDRARAAVRLRERRDAQPLRARPRTEPRGSARVDAGLPRRRRAARRLRDRQRAAVRQQRLTRRLRADRAGAVVPRREVGDDEGPAPGDARAAIEAVRPAVHDTRRGRGRRRDPGHGLEQPVRHRRVARQRDAPSPRLRQARRLRGDDEHRRRRRPCSSRRPRSASADAAAYWHEFTATSFEVRSRSGDAFAGVDGEALQLPTPLRFEIHPAA